MARSPMPLVVLLAVLLLPTCGDDEGGPFDPEDNPADTTGSGLKPDTIPTLSSVALYSSESPVNTPIEADPAVDPGSGAMISKLAGAGAMVITWRQYSAPVYFADAATAKVEVSLECGPVWEMGVSRMTGVPIPAWATPANDTEGSVPPVGCGEESDQDNHMIVFDLASRCEYDFWQMRRAGGGWAASWGNSISMDSDGIYPSGLSTRGSGFAFPAGVIWPDELRDGEIRHALAMTSPYTRSGGPVSPATDSDGVTDGADAIPEGARIQLDPALDLEAMGLTGYELTIGRALQTYGAFMIDTGGEGGIGLYAVDPRSTRTDPYAGALPDVTWPTLPSIPVSSFRVLLMGPQDGDFESKLQLAESGCATMS